MFTDAGKTASGTGAVKIKKKEVGKKNASTYSKSKGNEAATRSFGMDVVSHALSGGTKHQAYSFDVLFEKSGAERFLDLTTTNHGSDPATAAGPDIETPDPGDGTPQPDCAAMRAELQGDRADVQGEIGAGTRGYLGFPRFRGQVHAASSDADLKLCS
jgi:hypothetical protein